MEDVVAILAVMTVPIAIMVIILNYSLKVKRMQIEANKPAQPGSAEISLSGQSIEVMQNLVDEIRSVRSGYQLVQDRLTRIEKALDLNTLSTESAPESKPLPDRRQMS